MAGLFLDPWQELCLTAALGEKPNGKWAATEVGLVVPRQNGKGSILEARELAGLFLLDERLIIHSAHEFSTSLEAFRRLLFLVENNDDLRRRVKRAPKAHGEEGIELKNGQRIRFRTRTKGGGRGLTGDCLILDEAMILAETAFGALLPTLSARPNPQVWYTGSAVDQNIHEHGRVLTRIRQRGHEGDEGLAYMEWSAEGEDPDSCDITDREAWAQANPGLGIRIGESHVGMELRAMAPRTFAVERLGVGDWPDLEHGEQALDVAAWEGVCTDAKSAMEDPIVLCYDVSPDRKWASIGAAGKRADGTPHVELVDRRLGTGWLLERLVDLNSKQHPAAIVCAASSPAASLMPELAERHVVVEALSSAQEAQACGVLYDAVDQKAVRHLGQKELNAAVRGAARRPLGDSWAWSRKSSSVDISPLVAVTFALWRLAGASRVSIYQTRGLL